MAETMNYHLYVEDDDQTLFKSWRQKMNGTQDSNMTKIDTALFAKADKDYVDTAIQNAIGAALEASY